MSVNLTTSIHIHIIDIKLKMVETLQQPFNALKGLQIYPSMTFLNPHRNFLNYTHSI
jgi:hypothetical protein